MAKTMTTYTTYHNDPLLKNEIVKRMADHVKTDTLIQGDYWNERYQKGSNVGCVLHSAYKSLFPKRLGLPVWMAYLHNRIHEELTLDDAREFSKVYSVIPVGITWGELEIIKYKFLRYILVESKYNSKQHCDEKGKDVTDKVVALHTRAINGDMPTEEEWRAAVDAAFAAVYAADYAATYAANYAARAANARTAYFAYSAAAFAAVYAADYAATYAADSAAARFSAAYFATKYAAMKDYADYYMKLFGGMEIDKQLNNL
jgi:hypothetical protein